MPTNLAVLVSHSGSLLEAMIKDGLPIKLVGADRECRGLKIAEEANIPTRLVKRLSFGPQFDREAYTRELIGVLEEHHIDLVAMAGFDTILGPAMSRRFGRNWLNIHPALLPSFKGHTAVADALAFGVKITGSTIHVATDELDHGPIIDQVAVRVEEGATVDSLWECIKQSERVMYPATLRKIMGI